MGCGESKARDGNGNLRPGGKRVTDAEGGDKLPDVPPNSWYGSAFTDVSPMPVSEFGTRYAGMVLFNTTHFPTAPQELHRLPGREPEGRGEDEDFVLGIDPIYGMSYFHDTALSVEHAWRLRVSHNTESANRYDKPFYDTLMAVQVYINDKLVPDQKPHDHSLKNCTATINSHEAVSVWRCLPVPLLPAENHFLLHTCHVYRSLIYSFAVAAASLRPGRHAVRVDVLYGCQKENDFLTEFIARGTLQLVVTPDSRDTVLKQVSLYEALMRDAQGRDCPLVPNTRRGGFCPKCNGPADYVCTVCAAKVCGKATCSFAMVEGYPHGCTAHLPPN